VTRVRKFVRPVLETLLAGVFIGYVGGVIAGQVAPVAQGTAPGEPREAHAFMGAVFHNDIGTQASLRPDRDPITRALELKANVQGRENVSAKSLTYLGGETRGRLGIHMYALEYVTDTGEQGLVPFTLTTGAGKVLRVV
jgi:hypothetical protein